MAGRVAGEWADLWQLVGEIIMKSVDTNEQRDRTVAGVLPGATKGTLAMWGFKVLLALAIVLVLCSAPFVAMNWVAADSSTLVPVVTRREDDTYIGYDTPEAAHCGPGETLIRNWRGGYSCNIGEWTE